MYQPNLFFSSALILLMALAPLQLTAQKKLRDLDRQRAEEVIAQIEAATPWQPRKLLVFSATHHFFVHTDSIAYGKEIFPMLGEMTLAYETVVSDDLELFEKENLAEFDAVLFNNTTGQPFRGSRDAWKKLSEDEREPLIEREKRLMSNLLEFVEIGKGFIGIHSATDTYTGEKKYIEMIGGKFAKHPWRKNNKAVVQVVDPDHPLTRNLMPDGPLSMVEEIYIHKGADNQWLTPDRADRHYLLILDVAASDPVETPVQFVPISWIKPYGDGRVFYSSLGHNPLAYETRETLEHYLRGIQFALGDFPVPAERSE